MKAIKYDPKNPNQDMTILPQDIWDKIEYILSKDNGFGFEPVIDFCGVPIKPLLYGNLVIPNKGNFISKIKGLHE